MIEMDDEGQFRFGILFDHADTTKLIELASYVGEDPYALLANAINTMWTAFTQKQVTTNG